jgi:hypothetical protein
MKETRKYEFKNKILDQEHLIAVAKLFIELSKELKTKSQSCAQFNLTFKDDITLDSNDLSIFESGETTMFRKLMKVFLIFVASEGSIDLGFHHGNCKSCNKLTVSGSDRLWVSRTFTSLKEAIDSITPQNLFFSKFKWLTIPLILISSGMILGFILSGIISVFGYSNSSAINFSKLLLKLKGSNTYWTFMLWNIRLFLGVLVTPFLYYQIGNVWPRIEIQVGPDHLNIAQRRRSLLLASWSGVFLPLIISFLFEFLKK